MHNANTKRLAHMHPSMLVCIFAVVSPLAYEANHQPLHVEGFNNSSSTGVAFNVTTVPLLKEE